ncbi:hypothetical protein MASR1M60_08070 [Rhodocyclaceae bacterium]
MTKDFRHVGRLPESESATPTQPTPSASQLASHHRLIIRVIYAMALGFFLAGLWILSGQPNPIPMPQETSFFLGIAFVISAITDLVIVIVLKRVWQKQVSAS